MTPGNNCAATALAGARGAGTSAQQASPKDTTTATRGKEQPEHRNDRRRFLVWAVLLGAAPPERLTERIVDELRQEAAE